MKVAMVTSWLSRSGGGVSAVVQELSRSLVETGVEVAVFGLEDEAWRDGDRDAWTGAPAMALHAKGPRSIGYAPKMAQRLMEWAPDIVHVHGIWMHPSRSVLQWARSTNKPYLISPHGMLDAWAVCNSKWKKRTVGWLYEDAHLKNAAGLHALCAPEAYAIRAFGLDQPVHIVPNGVEPPDEVGDDVPIAPWRDAVPREANVMLFLGRIHPKKNLDRFLCAWAAVRDHVGGTKPWHLVIAGWDQGGHERELRDKCTKVGISNSVLFVGPLFGAQKAAAFRNAHTFVLPSVSEGLPMAVLEAWSYGLPVLMSDACNLPEGFDADAARRLALSEKEMVDSLRSFMRSETAALDLMAQNAKLLVADRYKWLSVARRFGKIYTSIGSDENSEAVNA